MRKVVQVARTTTNASNLLLGWLLTHKRASIRSVIQSTEQRQRGLGNLEAIASLLFVHACSFPRRLGMRQNDGQGSGLDVLFASSPV